MARLNVPTIPDDKINYFREQLYRELSHMFEWENLPQTIPHDYLERNLVRNGTLLFYKDENIGLDVLRCEVTGYNRHNLPTNARTFTPTTNNEVHTQITRNIKRLTDSENAIEQFNENNDGVLINNMEYGKSCESIVDHFSRRLAIIQLAFDTNLMYQNIPYIFQTSSDDTRLSIEKMFAEMFTGKPFIITDKMLFADNKDRTGIPTDIKYIGKELMDTRNEMMMKFRETVGIDTAGVDKAERLLTGEIQSNKQHTKTVLQIMLEQRQIACENINSFFGTDITVDVIGRDELEEGGEEYGSSDDRVEESFEE